MCICLNILGKIILSGAFVLPSIEISSNIFNNESFSLMQNGTVSILGPDDM